VQKSPAPPPQNREQTIAYILDMSIGLAELARSQDLKFLAYLLEMTALACVGGHVDHPRIRVGGKLK
jgi:hypothetical protein